MSTLVPVDTRKQVVDRVLASRYLSKSARLRDLLIYVTRRVLDEGVIDIHEQEVGHRVFGRAPDYDTAIDNTVRVHASNLRKRLEQYFTEEGRDEPIIIELPKGNYAPVFRVRALAATPEAPMPSRAELPHGDWRIYALVTLVLVLAGCTAYLLATRATVLTGPMFAHKPTVRELWSAVFPSGKLTDVILDDAAVALYQDLTGRAVPLSEYYDRDYLRDLTGAEQKTAGAIVLKRYSSYAFASILWKLSELSSQLGNSGNVHFARDYSFRAMRNSNLLLLGTARSNPWIEAYESKLGFRWRAEGGFSYPVDIRAAQPHNEHSGTQEMFATVALLSNVGGTGNVLILSGTGGSAVAAAADFLTDETSVAQLRSRLSQGPKTGFPHFEALLRVTPRSRQVKDTSILVARPLE